MAVSRISLMEYRGLNADAKPTTYGGVAIPANAEFLETDTRKLFYFDGASTWTEQDISTSAITGDVSLATGVTGTLPIANGGTANTTATTAFDALSPMTTLGDVIYGGASGTRTRLAGNITTTKQYLAQTGDGANSAAPAWYTPKALIMFPFAWNATTTSVTYVHVFNPFETSTAETNIDIIFDYAFRIKRFRVTMTQNAKTGTSTFSFRDDAVDVVQVSVLTTALGEHDSGAVDVAVAAGSKISFKVDASTGGANALKGSGYIIAEVDII